MPNDYTWSMYEVSADDESLAITRRETATGDVDDALRIDATSLVCTHGAGIRVGTSAASTSVGLEASAAQVPAEVVYTLPPTLPAAPGTTLTGDAAGQLSWSTSSRRHLAYSGSTTLVNDGTLEIIYDAGTKQVMVRLSYAGSAWWDVCQDMIKGGTASTASAHSVAAVDQYLNGTTYYFCGYGRSSQATRDPNFDLASYGSRSDIWFMREGSLTAPVYHVVTTCSSSAALFSVVETFTP